MEPGHRQIDHTADLGFELWAPDEPALLAEAMRAVVRVMVGSLPEEGRETRTVALEGIDAPDRLIRWLNELIYLTTVERFVPISARLELGPSPEHTLHATLQGSTRVPLHTELKAATYHDLVLECDEGRAFARVILDV